MATLPAGCPTDAFAALDYLKKRPALSVDDMKIRAMKEETRHFERVAEVRKILALA